MLLRKAVTAGVLAIGLAASVSGSVAAQSADTTPPNLSVTPRPAFVVGSTVHPSSFAIPDEGLYYFIADLLLIWSATDPSGICGYDVEELGDGDQQVLVFDSLQTSAVVQGDDYDASYGGGSLVTQGWEVRARDCAGNTAVVEVPQRLRVRQEDAFTYRRAYTGGWATSMCQCWMATQTRYTRAKGASAAVTLTAEPGQHVGVVMPKGPDRGKAAVYVDGRRRATVDTFSRTRAHRQIVWEARLTRGSHTIKVVNLATSGHPRIDIDGLVLH
jgi:hypothetical protein